MLLHGWTRPHRQAASIAQALIEMGVKAVVAAGWAVNDAAGLVFARSFYQSMLGGGLKFGEAVKRARQDTYALGRNNTWGAYQCYGNPDFALTPQAGAAEPAEADVLFTTRVRGRTAGRGGAIHGRAAGPDEVAGRMGCRVGPCADFRLAGRRIALRAGRGL